MEMRDPKLKALKIRMKYIRFFFKKCDVCGMEFRKTNMWSWKGSDGWDDITRFACTSCIPDYDDLMRHIHGDFVSYGTFAVDKFLPETEAIIKENQECGIA